MKTLLTASLLLATSALAAPIYDPEDPLPVPHCLNDIVLNSFTATTPVNLGSSAQLAWNITPPAGCTDLSFTLAGQTVGRYGALVVSPNASTTYFLFAKYLTTTQILGQVNVAVTLPATVNIGSNDQQRLLVQALGTPNTTILVANNVNMDLSHWDGISVASGVRLLGGRTSRIAGPRLFTTTRPYALFIIRGDGVKFSGLRIEGAEMGIGDGDSNLSRGIQVQSANNVEIDHNEISGWAAVGVSVADPDNRIDPVRNPETVRIHDNFIHHNQFYARFGYGVSLGAGAYALIEHNVFDWNRHAIAANGEMTTGYRAIGNLVLEHGGYHRWWGWPFGWDRTHQFDMHGTDSCGIGDLVSDSVYNCGWGGHDVSVRNNSFFYTAAPAFKLRGTPAVTPWGAFVTNNVFKHGSLGDAVQQTQSGLYTANNQLGVNAMNELGSCDFDADGVNDSFLATGQTWWFSSGGTGAWTYLNTSTLRRANVSLGMFDNRAGCDVMANGTIWSGGTTVYPVFSSTLGTIKM